MDPLQKVVFGRLTAVDGINAVGSGGRAAKTGMNTFAPQQTPDKYGQYDRALEQGVDGAQYRGGVLIGKILNISG